MAIDRLERVNALIKREIGESLYHIINDRQFDLAAVTITHVVTARNLRSAKVLVSIRGDESQQRHMLSLLRRHRPEIQQAINRDLTLKYTPKLHFELDHSIQSGDHVLEILSHLDIPDDNNEVPGTNLQEEDNSL